MERRTGRSEVSARFSAIRLVEMTMATRNEYDYKFDGNAIS
ncbi:MAG: hypothetical protein QM727_13505 [Niabella sp.]